MGNSPSTSKPATPTPGSTNDSSRASRGQSRNLIPGQQHRPSVASPEATVVQAQGSTIVNRTSQSRPLSVLNSSSPSASSNSSAAPAKTSEPRPRQSDLKHESTKPVAVPVSNPDPPVRSSDKDAQFGGSYLPSGPTSSSNTDMAYQMARPPRLPLPIDEEVHTPGSPIIAPRDGESVDEELDQSGLPRRSSGLSNGNGTDEEDAEELRVDKSRPSVPTHIEWLRGGQKVYVTGTPLQWARKQRLFPSKDREGVFETVIPVFPGTHHIKFLVDHVMQTSPDLPTTVDFGNNLVNYIEVSGEDAPAKNVAVDAMAPKSNKDAEALPSRVPSMLDEQEKSATKKTFVPEGTFEGRMPSYMSDFDQAEDTRSYQLSVNALEKLPTPPSLPGFLTKPIMNNTTLVKDDNSVLNMPNHTVLNHLATSSIKNNILSVSATTRYQNKYVTTIIYKPTTTEDA